MQWVLQLWSSLPKKVVDVKSLNEFKGTLETFMEDTSIQCCHVNKSYIWLRSAGESDAYACPVFLPFLRHSLERNVKVRLLVWSDKLQSYL